MPAPRPSAASFTSSWAVAAAAAVAALAACSSAPSAPPAGGERGECRAQRGCDVGLECWSDRCVRPPPADCPAVAERLASVRLGNYATREERAALVGELTGQCRSERLTAAEGRCIVEAADNPALVACPRPLLPELAGGDPAACRAIGAKVTQFIRERAPQADPLGLGLGLFGPDLSRVAREIEESCRTQRWPAEVTACAVEALTPDDLIGCSDGLSAAARADVSRRLAPLIPEPPPPTPYDPDDPWASTGPTRPRGGLAPSVPPEAPAQPVTTGLPRSCLDYIALVDRWAACPSTAPEMATSLRQATDAMRSSLAQMPPGTAAAAEQACRDATTAIRQAMASSGC